MAKNFAYPCLEVVWVAKWISSSSSIIFSQCMFIRLLQWICNWLWSGYKRPWVFVNCIQCEMNKPKDYSFTLHAKNYNVSNWYIKASWFSLTHLIPIQILTVHNQEVNNTNWRRTDKKFKLVSNIDKINLFSRMT